MSRGILGSLTCISADQECKDEYGVMARYNSLYDKCECFSGYIFDKNILGNLECISEDKYCQNRYGYNSEYNNLSDKCECRSGYEFTLKSSGGLECESCSSKYGYHSSYNYSRKKCECDDDYTLDDDNQCVEKQNNVYFTLEALDTYNNRAIVKSDYDYREYLVEYGVGCLSIESYVNKKIVINLGTDFNLDTWDKIVLQNNSQTCNIIYKESTFGTSDLCDDGYILEQNSCEEIICPAHATLIGSRCLCNAGYQLNSSQTTCVLIPIPKKEETVSVQTYNSPTVTSSQNTVKNNEDNVVQDVIKPEEEPRSEVQTATQTKINPVKRVFSNIWGFLKNIFR